MLSCRLGCTPSALMPRRLTSSTAPAGPPAPSQQQPAPESQLQTPAAAPPTAAASAATATRAAGAAPGAVAARSSAVPSAQPISAASATPGTALAAEMSAAVRKMPASVPSLGEAQQRVKGTASNGKWAQYEGSQGGVPRTRRRQRTVSAGETLHAAVRSTSRLRLLLAALLAVLLAGRWDAAAVIKAGTAGSTHVEPATAAPSATTPSTLPPQAGSSPGLWGRLQAQWEQALAAFAPLTQGREKEIPHGRQAAPTKSSSFAGLLAGQLELVQGQLAAAGAAVTAAASATPAGQRAGAAVQQVRRQLAAAAASPAGQHASEAIQAARRQLAAAAASPAGQHTRAAARSAGKGLAAAGSWAGVQLGAARSSYLGQQAAAAIARLPPLARLPGLLQGRLTAAAVTPVGRQVMAFLDRTPPLASLLLLDLSLVGAAAAAMAAAPGLVHSTLELELQTPGLLQRLASYLPGLSRHLSLASALPRLLTGLLDDAAAFTVALLAYYQLPALLAGA